MLYFANLIAYLEYEHENEKGCVYFILFVYMFPNILELGLDQPSYSHKEGHMMVKHVLIILCFISNYEYEP